MKRLAVIALAALTATPTIAQERRIKLRAEGGAYYVPVVINKTVQLEFQVDTGANIVTVPGYVGLTMWKSGTLSKGDIGGVHEARNANGSTTKLLQIRFRDLQIGTGSNAVIGHSVIGSIGDENEALLLGTTFLQQFKSFSIDHSTGELVIDDTPNPYYAPPSFQSADLAEPPPPRQRQPQPQYQQPAPNYAQPNYPQPYYPPAPYVAPAPCPACIVGGIAGAIIGGALMRPRGYGGWGGYRGGYRGWHR